MRRLTCIRRREDGAIAAIVVVLFAGGVMLALGALTVDVGNINANRRVLQNGADAAVLSVATDCIKGVCPAPGDLALRNLVNTNAATGVTGMAEVRRVDGKVAVCGTGVGMTGCTEAASTSNLQECPEATIPAGAKGYVRVYTETKSAGGNILPYSFGAAIAGVGSGANQQTCAAAAWGPLKQRTAAVPITISECMFNEMRRAYGYDPLHPELWNVNQLPPAPVGAWPGYGVGSAPAWPAKSKEQVEYTTKYASTCPTSNGHTANGSFGWLTANNCQTIVNSGQWIKGDPGNDMACTDLYKYWGTAVALPVFDCVVAPTAQEPDPTSAPLSGATCSIPNSGGNNVWYHIKGWASFYLSGFRFGGSTDQTPGAPSAMKQSLIPVRADPCGSPQSCLSGWLTKNVELGTIGDVGQYDYGVQAIQILG